MANRVAAGLVAAKENKLPKRRSPSLRGAFFQILVEAARIELASKTAVPQVTTSVSSVLFSAAVSPEAG